MHPKTYTRALALGLALVVSAPGAGFAQDATTAEQTVDAMNKLWGRHPGLRANHAKGVVLQGSFTPTPEAAKLSKASLFAGPAVTVTVRFSDGTGLPTIADGAKEARPHGFSAKFKLADGGEVDMVLNSLPHFPVATGEEFRDLLVAISQSGPDVPSPKPVETFRASHPAVAAAVGALTTPESFARQAYNGVNAFVFVDAAGKRQAFRWRVEPVAGIATLNAEEAGKRPANFLQEEIVARVAKEPVAFRFLAQLAEPGDPTHDATKPWPKERRMVEMGTLTLTQAVPDSASAEKALLFLPNALTDGIEVSDDPLIDARVQAYAVSFGRRQ
ncbi:catalase family peroxidase [Methylorubrum zatmanii]|uniref:Catalase-related peroxidase n=1 Tax=Methylorubrum zatmanii TaxID=29429 RepID=A0ABW1WHT9_9HYPH|nr:catalase family peroxidase [Methylorubrum zatmanii]